MFILKSLVLKNFISFRDQTFQFRNGKAVLVIGENLDDASQKGNGSGKSSLIEGIAKAISGSSIRKVKDKELIFNGAESAEIDLLMDNSLTGGTFRIWRSIYSNSKSGEYKAWIDGKEQSDRYSDANSFNDFVWLTLGITSEDFFSFFLITSDSYTPFLRIGDTAKKEVINRFSGADRVDATLPLVALDSAAVQADITKLEADLLRNTTKQELYANQITEEENKTSEEKRNEVIASKNVEMDNLIASFEAAINATEVAQQAFIGAEKMVSDFQYKKDYVAEKERIGIQKYILTQELTAENNNLLRVKKNFQVELDKIATDSQLVIDNKRIKEASLLKVKDKFQTEVATIITNEAKLNGDLKKLQLELQENETFHSEVTKNLMDTIECPSCKHKFLLRDEEFDVETAKAALPELEIEIAAIKKSIADIKTKINVDIQHDKNAVNEKIIAAKEVITTDITNLNAELIALADKTTAVNKKINDASQATLKEINRVNLEIAGLNQKISDLDQEQHVDDMAKQRLVNAAKNAELTLNQKVKEGESINESITALELLITNLSTQPIDHSNLDNLKIEVEKLVIFENNIKNDLEKKRKEKEAIDAWDLNFKNFKSHLANKSILNIQDYTNMFLQGMGSNLAINIDGYKTLASKKIKEQITTTVMRDGFDAGSYGKFSGGERGRIDICTILAMQELIQINSATGGVDLLIADEILDQVDSMGLEAIVTSLQTTGKTIMIVSQNEVNALEGYSVTIQKQNKVSTILN